MLTPEYLWSIADSVVNIYDEMNKWSIEDIAERIMKAELYNHSGLPGTARYRAWLLNQSGEHYEKMALQLSVLTKKADSEIMKLFIDAGLTAIDNDFAPYNKEPYNLKKDPVATQILQAAYDQTKGELHNYTRTTLDESNKLLINNMDRAYFEVSTGQKSYSEAITDAIKEVASTGSTVRYRTGHVDTIEVAVRRAVMTGVNQGACKVSLHNCELLGAEYVIIDAHMGARYNENNKIANHMGWQGKVYKINGSDQYPNLEEETGFPSDPLGLAGYNCRHSFYAFFPGIDNPDKFKDIVTDEEESKRQYDMSQKQRKFERDIRKSKDLLVGYETAIDHCKDEQTKFELQMMYDRASAKLQRQNKVYNEFCKDNDLQKEYDRIKTAKWNREQSRKAMSGAKRYNDAKQSNDIYKSKFTESLHDFNNGQKDIINHRNIEKELNKSDVGKEVIKYLEENPTYVRMCYKVKFDDGVLGYYEPSYQEIYINCSATKTIEKTTEIIIHEVTHKRLNIGGDLKSEVICKIYEQMHHNRTNKLTYEEIRSIIKSVKELYPEYKGIWKRK